MIIVEPDRRAWLQARSGAEAVAKLDERLSAALNSGMNLVYTSRGHKLRFFKTLKPQGKQ